MRGTTSVVAVVPAARWSKVTSRSASDDDGRRREPLSWTRRVAAGFAEREGPGDDRWRRRPARRIRRRAEPADGAESKVAASSEGLPRTVRLAEGAQDGSQLAGAGRLDGPDKAALVKQQDTVRVSGHGGFVRHHDDGLA